MGEPPTEGERWAARELTRLRDSRWSPRAVVRFLGESQRRANLSRQRRPEDSGRAAVWMLLGAAAWLLGGRLDSAGPWRGARGTGLAWWAACALMLDWHLGMLETPDGRAVSLGVADALTLMRAWLVPAVARDPGPGLLLIGGLTDLADGAIARRTRVTRLGRDLEGLVDAGFTIAALRGCVRTRRVSRAPVALELVRLGAGTGYACAVYFTRGHAPDRALSRGGRRAAPVRIAGLICAGRGHRRLADRLLLAGSGLAVAGFAQQLVTRAQR